MTNESVNSPDAPTTTNAAGGKQSELPARFDLLPPHATQCVAEILHQGNCKYDSEDGQPVKEDTPNWYSITSWEHLNHAMAHINSHNMGDTSDDHLGHAACRMLMALEIFISETRSARQSEPDPSPSE